MRVLMVCLGNICRSPMAEAMLRHEIAVRELDWEVDSCGTGDWHVGGPADHRTLATLARKGIEPPSLARQLRRSDFQEFDLILAMDHANERTIKAWPGAIADKVRRIGEFATPPFDEVPDPYYHSDAEFERTHLLLKDAIDGLLIQYATA